jgi:TolB-like protein/class 3 adenylate cyclase/Tfp pilus assembly protein PilF
MFMPTARVERRLAAIMVADIVGYSRLIETDEARTLAAIRTLRSQIIEPLLAEFGGRVVKLMGDGAIVEFSSVVDAVICAAGLQEAVSHNQLEVPSERRIVFRIGINLGDVVVQGDDLLGDGVNIAARLEALAEPGGICITDTVKMQLSGKTDLSFEDAGEQTLRNIAHPIRIYHLNSQLPLDVRIDGRLPTRPALPNKASIAVLPFTNMSSDAEQEYFADGLAEDLITDLSKVPGLLVIARNSTFAYKGKPVDIRSVANDLGVRYVVEGSVRRSAARVRINAQLIDATDNTHLWADRFDRDLTDIFVLQDEVVGKIVSALSGVMRSTLAHGARRAANLEAYDLFVRGRALVTRSPETNRAAPPLLERAIELDPDFAEASAWLAMSHHFAWAYWLEPPERHASLALAAAQRAVSLDPESATAHAILGDVLIYGGQPEDGAAELATALRLSANHADAWTFLGQLKAFEGTPLEGIDYVRTALRLNPHPPGWYRWILGLAQYAARRYEDAVETLRHEATHRLGSQRILAASLAQLGRMEEARTEAGQFLASNPSFSMDHWATTQPFRHAADRRHFIDGYIKAGLPR